MSKRPKAPEGASPEDVTMLGLNAVVRELERDGLPSVRRDTGSPFYVVDFNGHAVMIHEQRVALFRGNESGLVDLLSNALDVCRRGEDAIWNALIDPIRTGGTRQQTIQLERVQFRDAVHLPCTDGARDSALAWRDDRPGHVLELDLSTRMVSISASDSMKSFRGLTSANRNHVIDVPLENVAYALRLTEQTKALIAGAKSKTRADHARENLV